MAFSINYTLTYDSKDNNLVVVPQPETNFVKKQWWNENNNSRGTLQSPQFTDPVVALQRSEINVGVCGEVQQQRRKQNMPTYVTCHFVSLRRDCYSCPNQDYKRNSFHWSKHTSTGLVWGSQHFHSSALSEFNQLIDHHFFCLGLIICMWLLLTKQKAKRLIAESHCLHYWFSG